MFRDSRRRRPRVLAAALLCAAVVTAAGCSPSTPDSTGPVTGTPGVSAPSTRLTATGSDLIPPDSGTGTTSKTVASSSAAGPPAPPRAATLSWLSGAHTDGGILVATDDGKRWQGERPGEYALVGGFGYQWFGATGSMVGCTTAGACVAVDPDGHLAVTTSATSPRLVYQADGNFIGRFSPDGDRLSSPVSTPSLAAAVSASGVDLAGLVNAATMGAPFAGGATGDPHVVTAGGVRLTTQTTGQYVARGGDSRHTIQLQLSPMAHRKDVSVVDQVAIGADGAVITVDMSGELTVDGTTRARQPDFEQITLSSGVTIGRWTVDTQRVVAVAVLWPDGGSVTVDANPALGLTVVAHLHADASATGLFGGGGLGPGPDLLDRSGAVKDTETAISSWRASDKELLFSAPQPPMADFPEEAAATDPGARGMATQACADAGITQAGDLAACAFDVALTGDTGFVAGHAALAESSENYPIATSFARRWPALAPGVILGAPSLPPDGRVDVTLPASGYKAFQVRLDRRGAVTLINHNGCGVGESPPGMDQPAMRLFDTGGHAVSDRLALCGHEKTPELPAGMYTLVVANGPSDQAGRVRVDVTLP